MRELAIVQPRPAQPRIRKLKAQRLDERQLRADVRRHAHHAACVRRDLGLVEDDPQQGRALLKNAVTGLGARANAVALRHRP